MRLLPVLHERLPRCTSLLSVLWSVYWSSFTVITCIFHSQERHNAIARTKSIFKSIFFRDRKKGIIIIIIDSNCAFVQRNREMVENDIYLRIIHVHITQVKQINYMIHIDIDNCYYFALSYRALAALNTNTEECPE